MMGCGSSRGKIVPESASTANESASTATTTTVPTKQLNTKVTLSSTKHLVLLFTTNQIRKSTCSIYEQRECDIREVNDEKYKEYADLLENPHLNIVPKKR